MKLSYTEELTYEYFKHITDDKGKPKYIVTAKIPFRGESKKEKGKKGVKGWHDIDVLAIGEDEICIVETKSFTGVKKPEEFIDEIINRFEAAENFVKELEFSKNKKIRKIFVPDYVSNREIIDELKNYGIEVIELKEIVKKLIDHLKTRLDEEGSKGKEESNVTRTLIFLIDKKFIK